MRGTQLALFSLLADPHIMSLTSMQQIILLMICSHSPDSASTVMRSAAQPRGRFHEAIEDWHAGEDGAKGVPGGSPGTVRGREQITHARQPQMEGVAGAGAPLFDARQAWYLLCLASIALPCVHIRPAARRACWYVYPAMAAMPPAWHAFQLPAAHTHCRVGSPMHSSPRADLGMLKNCVPVLAPR